MTCLPCLPVCMRACVRWLHFNKNLCKSISYEDIFTTVAESVYGYKNMSVKLLSSLYKTKWPP